MNLYNDNEDSYKELIPPTLQKFIRSKLKVINTKKNRFQQFHRKSLKLILVYQQLYNMLILHIYLIRRS